MTPRVPHGARGVLLAGFLLAAAGSVLFSAKAVVIKLAYRHGVDPLTLLALRMFLDHVSDFVVEAVPR